jgi:hypothetical protein
MVKKKHINLLKKMTKYFKAKFVTFGTIIAYKQLKSYGYHTYQIGELILSNFALC